jgi:acyl-coenzyme A thioesterase PaaI-like protein
LLSLPGSPRYLNHLGTVHAGAQLALAEASSGEFLLRRFGALAGIVPVVRRLEAKFAHPARGRLFARATASEPVLNKLGTDLAERGRGIVKLSVEVIDQDQAVTLKAIIEWFIATTTAMAAPPSG